MPSVALICVGSELLRGKINTHASTISRYLCALGLSLVAEQTVSDDQSTIASAIASALHTHNIVLVTGGLGPTFDDLTREAAAEATGYALELSLPLLREIKQKFKRAKLPSMPPANERQAYLLEKAEALSNTVGTAPGQWLEVPGSGAILVLLPGPPSEMEPMFTGFVMPRLKRRFPAGARAEAHMHFVGVPESVIDQQVRPIIEKYKGCEFTILAKPGLVDLDIFVQEKSVARARACLGRIVLAIQRKTRPSFYGMDEDFPLEKVVMKRFLSQKATLSVAESCTGGLLAKRLTDASGSSKYFLGGVVSYANSVKRSMLEVSREVLWKHGAVSEEVALAMAHGVRSKFGSAWALSITGIAGPGGGTAKKPVGLVYIALVGPKSKKSYRFHFRGSRSVIRDRAVTAALSLLRIA
jgi:nicotinamide-nucleotide amidase